MGDIGCLTFATPVTQDAPLARNPIHKNFTPTRQDDGNDTPRPLTHFAHNGCGRLADAECSGDYPQGLSSVA